MTYGICFKLIQKERGGSGHGEGRTGQCSVATEATYATLFLYMFKFSLINKKKN